MAGCYCISKMWSVWSEICQLMGEAAVVLVLCKCLCHQSLIEYRAAALPRNSWKGIHFSRSWNTHTHTHPFNGRFRWLSRWASTRKVKPIWILLKQETVSGSGISWAICKSAPCSRKITMPAPHHSVFCRPDALLAAQPTASKHWRQFPGPGKSLKTEYSF